MRLESFFLCAGAATTVVECNDRSSEPWDAVGRSYIMHRNVRLLPALIRAFDRMERIRVWFYRASFTEDE